MHFDSVDSLSSVRVLDATAVGAAKAAECRQSNSRQNANAKMLIKTCVSESSKTLHAASSSSLLFKICSFLSCC